MECDKIKPLLDDFAEGELRSPRKEMVEEHLKTCAVCREDLSVVRNTIRLLAEAGEVKEPPDFIQRVRQRIDAQQKHRILRRLVPRPAMLKVLVSAGCVMLACLGVWLVYKQFWQAPPSPVAKHAPQPSAKVTVIARAPTESEELPSRTTGELRWATPRAEKEALSFRGRENEEAYALARAKGLFRQERAPETPLERAEEDTEAAWVNKAGYGKAGKMLREQAARVAGVAPEKRTAETGAQLVLGQTLAAPREAEEPKARPPGDASEYISEKAGGDSMTLPALHIREAEKAEVAEKAQASDFAAVPSLAAPADSIIGTGGVVGRRAAARDSAISSRGESPAVWDETELRKAAPAGPVSRAAGAEIDVDGDGRRRRQPEKAGQQEFSLYEVQLEAQKPSQHEKNAAGSFVYDNGLHDFSDESVLPEEGATARQRIQTHGVNGRADVLLRGDVSVGRYYAIPGAAREILMAVEDREKAMAEIRKIVTDLGGTIGSPVQGEHRPSRGSGTPHPDLIIVKLNAVAYEQFKERVLARGVSRGFLTTQLNLQNLAEKTRVAAQQQGTITLLIRLIEMTQQQQKQKPPAR